MTSSGIRQAKSSLLPTLKLMFSTLIADVVKLRRRAAEICGSADKYKENLMLSKKIVISARAGIHDFVNVGDNGTMQPYQVEAMLRGR